MKKSKISIIVPCYNEESCLPDFYAEIQKVMEQMEQYEFEILFIDDGSVDQTFAVIKQYAGKDDRVKYLSFSRNFGKEAAMYAGFCHAAGDFVVTMDADLQDPPSLLPEMVECLESGEYDSVATRRVSRKGEPKIRSFCARQFYRIINRFSEADIADGARDFRLMNRKMTDAVVSLGEYNRFSKGIFGWVGFKTKWIEYENVERCAGETKWSFFKLVAYAMDGIVNFSHMPLMIASYLGLGMTGLSFLAILFIIIRKLLFQDSSVYGWASMACIITLIGGLQLFCIGIMGQYISKTYLEVKQRPIYIINETNLQTGETVWNKQGISMRS